MPPPDTAQRAAGPETGAPTLRASSAGPASPHIQPTEAEIAALASAIAALSPGVAVAEAERAAEIAFLYPLELARAYEIEDPPYWHNVKVLHGLKPRGTCWHWATDLEARLRREGFRTLRLHRAIAEPTLRLDHATVVISAEGQTMVQGLVFDPWRLGFGRLYWGSVTEDRGYRWEEQAVVIARRRAARAPRPEG